jgi:hypothetical protein
MQPAEVRRQNGMAKHIRLLENIMIFFKILTIIFICKYFQEYCHKPKDVSKLCKPKVMTSAAVPKKWKNFRFW